MRNILVAMREETETEHRRVERHAVLRPLMDSSLSLQQYARVIAAFTGFYESLELRIKETWSHRDFPNYRYQPRLPLLLEDQAALPICAVALCATAPELNREDELIGVLYVLEGATQGGRIIGPLLGERLALTESTGARYFNFHRQRSWHEFRTMVEQCQQHYDFHIAVAAARSTFECLHSHLDLCLSSYGD